MLPGQSSYELYVIRVDLFRISAWSFKKVTLHTTYKPAVLISLPSLLAGSEAGAYEVSRLETISHSSDSLGAYSLCVFDPSTRALRSKYTMPCNLTPCCGHFFHASCFFSPILTSDNYSFQSLYFSKSAPPAPNSMPLSPRQRTLTRATTHAFRGQDLRVSIITAVLVLANLAVCIHRSSRVYLFQQSLCLQHCLATDPRQVGPHRLVEKSLCKVKQVQSTLSIIEGVDAFLQLLPGPL